MKIRTLVVGALSSNCYIVKCESTGEGIVIDPGGDGSYILNSLKEMDVKLKYIINTHGHGDHISANDEVKDGAGGQVIIHRLDGEMLTEPMLNLSSWSGKKVTLKKADYFVEDGEEIVFGEITAKVMHTPGHTQGGICLLIDKYLFSGDTLFQGSIGRTDLPGGSGTQIINSIKKKLLPLDEDSVVLPGHGPKSDIKLEKLYNPFLR